MDIILASASPRRKELLAYLGTNFRVLIPMTDETLLPDEKPIDYCLRVSLDKACIIADANPDSAVIAADTIVVIKERILGKPESISEAREFLNLLGGQIHEVYTGYSIICRTRNIVKSRAVKSLVEFNHMSALEIEWYIASGEPMDKAGAYALQGIASAFIKGITGSYTNVIGLPLSELYSDMKALDILIS